MLLLIVVGICIDAIVTGVIVAKITLVVTTIVAGIVLTTAIVVAAIVLMTTAAATTSAAVTIGGFVFSTFENAAASAGFAVMGHVVAFTVNFLASIKLLTANVAAAGLVAVNIGILLRYILLSLALLLLFLFIST